MTRAQAIAILQRAAVDLAYQLPEDAIVRWVAIEVKRA
jgi:hypothetical protein